MRDLQEALSTSIDNATTFTRALFAGSDWSATAVAAWINATRDLVVATVTVRGKPHAVPVMSGCVRGIIHFTVHPESLLFRNLTRDASLAFSMGALGHTMIGQGSAVAVARSLDAPDLIEELAAASTIGHFTSAEWDGWVYAIEIDRIFAS